MNINEYSLSTYEHACTRRRGCAVVDQDHAVQGPSSSVTSSELFRMRLADFVIMDAKKPTKQKAWVDWNRLEIVRIFLQIMNFRETIEPSSKMRLAEGSGSRL